MQSQTYGLFNDCSFCLLASVSLHVKVPCVGDDLNCVPIASLSQSTRRDSDPAAGLT